MFFVFHEIFFSKILGGLENEICDFMDEVEAKEGKEFDYLISCLEQCKKRLVTPWKINMEHTNHPFRKENDLPNLYDYVPC